MLSSRKPWVDAKYDFITKMAASYSAEVDERRLLLKVISEVTKLTDKAKDVAERVA
jgi:hypothetical protein